MELKTIKSKVEYALEYIPSTRESDKKLIAAVYRLSGSNPRMAFEDVLEAPDLPTFEAITRAARYLRKIRPEFRPSKEVESVKKDLEEEYRKEFSNEQL